MYVCTYTASTIPRESHRASASLRREMNVCGTVTCLVVALQTTTFACTQEKPKPPFRSAQHGSINRPSNFPLFRSKKYFLVNHCRPLSPPPGLLNPRILDSPLPFYVSDRLMKSSVDDMTMIPGFWFCKEKKKIFLLSLLFSSGKSEL